MALRIPSGFTMAQIPALKQGLSVTPPDVIQFLEASEYDLILAMVANNCWTGPVPPPPATTAKGDASFGLVPYSSRSRRKLCSTAIDSLPAWVQDVVERLSEGRSSNTCRPGSTSQNYATLITSVTTKGGLVGDDGSVYGFGKYECLDFNWLWAVFDHLYTRAIGNDPYAFAAPAADRARRSRLRPGHDRDGRRLGDRPVRRSAPTARARPST